MIVWLWPQIIPLSFGYYISLISLWFLIFLIVFSETALFINLKRSFSKILFFHFFLALHSCQFWFSPSFLIELNDYVLFSIQIYDLVLVLNCASLLEVFQLFQISFFQVKIVNHCDNHIIFQDTEHHLKKISFITIFIVLFYKTL